MNEFNPVVTAPWLLKELNNPKIVIIDCRFRLDNPNWGYQQYHKNHIPGAYYLDLNKDLSSPVAQHGGRHPLPEPNLFVEKLNSIGITNQSFIVAYDDSFPTFSARLWWLLRYLGHSQVAILNGGFSHWLELGYPVSETIPLPQQGHFIPSPQKDWVVDITQVKTEQNSPHVILVDSRSPERYRGEIEPIDPIPGSIPNALNSFWQEACDSQGFLKSKSEQQKLWHSYANTQDIILYCGSGVTACVNWLSLEIAGFPHPRLYPGGWSDWCSYIVREYKS